MTDKKEEEREKINNFEDLSSLQVLLVPITNHTFPPSIPGSHRGGVEGREGNSTAVTSPWASDQNSQDYKMQTIQGITYPRTDFLRKEKKRPMRPVVLQGNLTQKFSASNRLRRSQAGYRDGGMEGCWSLSHSPRVPQSPVPQSMRPFF